MADRSPNHQSLAVEARALLDVLAEKLQAATATVPDAAVPDTAEPDAPAAEHPPRCAGCPVCATLNYLSDHRELSTQLAQGALLIVGALRQYLEHPPSASPTPSDPSPASVQRIDIS